MGVALPAVAFEFAAAGSQSSESALTGSGGAFLTRLVVLAIPLILVAARWRSGSTTSGARSTAAQRPAAPPD